MVINETTNFAKEEVRLAHNGFARTVCAIVQVIINTSVCVYAVLAAKQVQCHHHVRGTRTMPLLCLAALLLEGVVVMYPSCRRYLQRQRWVDEDVDGYHAEVDLGNIVSAMKQHTWGSVSLEDAPRRDDDVVLHVRSPRNCITHRPACGWCCLSWSARRRSWPITKRTHTSRCFGPACCSFGLIKCILLRRCSNVMVRGNCMYFA
jgi:hypothetical protein